MSHKSNLLHETKTDIEASGHKPEDIVFIGSQGADGHECSWEEFQRLADQSYDCGFGGAEVAADLRIVFSDGHQMWRGEYDGSEWWEYSVPFVRPSEKRPIRSLFRGIGAFETGLARINEEAADANQ